MPHISISSKTEKNTQSINCTRLTKIALFISGLFCAATPALGACVNGGTNEKGGININCTAGGSFDYVMFGDNSSHNNVTTNGTIKSDIYGSYKYGESTILNGDGNILTINKHEGSVPSVNNGTSAYSVSFITEATSPISFKVNNNSLIINNSSFIVASAADIISRNNIPNSSAGILSGDMSGSAEYNSITLNNSFSNNVYGTSVANVEGVNDSIINNNTVTLNDSVAGSVFGAQTYGPARSVTMNNNQVNINGKSNVTLYLHGASLGIGLMEENFPDKYDAFTGNTLNFSATPIVDLLSVLNFEYYNFTVDPALVNTDTALISADKIAFGTNSLNISDAEKSPVTPSKIKVVGIKAGQELFAGNTFVLMKAKDDMSGAAEGLTTYGVAQQGVSLLYDVQTNVNLQDKQVTATILGNNNPVDPGLPAARVNPQLKALSEGHLASAMTLNRGADTLAYNTVHTIQHQNPDKGLAPFISLSGGKNRYNTGSHINAKDGLLTGGLSYLTDNLVSAVMIESGWGSYKTHNSFSSVNDVNGNGHNRYVGAAILGHYDFDSGVFAEASLRAGKNRNTYDTKDIVNLSTGERVHYNLDSNYLGAHIGTGYHKALDEKNTMDVSARYLWTQLKGKNVNVAGDNIHFDDINSHRVRLDTGLSHQYTEGVAVRAGLGYEYEFDGKAKASTYGYDIAAPGVQGSTAILTLGSTVKPLASQPLSMDVNLNGYTGKRDGVGGNVKFSYAF